MEMPHLVAQSDFSSPVLIGIVCINALAHALARREVGEKTLP